MLVLPVINTAPNANNCVAFNSFDQKLVITVLPQKFKFAYDIQDNKTILHYTK